MGRHSKVEPPDDDPGWGAPAPRGPLYGAPPGPPYDAFSGPTDDRVYVSSHDRIPTGPPHDRISTGPPPGAEQHRNGFADRDPFEPLPGGRQGAPGSRFRAAPGPPEPEPRGDPSRRRRWLRVLSVLPVPLMPILALVIAVGIVSYALSTQQISLNFAGGAPQNTQQTDQRDNQVPQNGPGQGTSRPDGLVIAFKVASRTPGGFKATATIANRGQEPVARWALAFKIPSASVTAITGATVVRTGAVAFVRGTGGIAPGESVRIVFAADGTAARPSSCVLNSVPCAIL